VVVQPTTAKFTPEDHLSISRVPSRGIPTMK
jgi:hypothetical protein